MSSHENPDRDHFRNMPAAVHRWAGALADLAAGPDYEEIFGHDVTLGLSGPQLKRLDDARGYVIDRLRKMGAGEPPA